METGKELLKKVLELKPQEKFFLLEGIIESLDKPDKDIDQIWAEEAEKRVRAYRAGKIKGIGYEQVFGETSL